MTRIRDVLDFPEELESRENCRESPSDLSHPAPCSGVRDPTVPRRDPHLEQWGKGAAGGSGEGSPKAGSTVRCDGRRWHLWSQSVA